MERRVIIFRGRVQGVGFRATARACARLQDVTGWVRNEADGSVRMEVQGEAREIDAVLTELRGRMGGNITSEDASLAPCGGDESSFTIRH